MLLLTLLSVALADSVESSAPVPILFDTDMASDCDDAGALAVLHELADRGEATILATVVNRGDANGRSASAVDAINTFCGRGDVPIGVDRDTRFIDHAGKAGKAGKSAFTTAIHEEFPHDARGRDETFPAAVEVMQAALRSPAACGPSSARQSRRPARPGRPAA